jgi:hypothetical protein
MRFSSSRIPVMRRSVPGTFGLALLALGAPLGAQAPAATPAPSGQPTIPLRPLGAVEARSSSSLGNVNQVRALRDGRVFVNDGQRRTVLLLDSALRTERIVSDSLEAPIPYGQRNMGLMPYVDDSTLLVDPATLSMLVLDRQGALVRVMAAPRSNDLNFLASANLGTHAFDTQGRLIYRLNQPGGFGGGGGGGGFGGGPPGGMAAMMMGGGGGGGRGGDRGGQQGGGQQGGGQQGGGQQGRGGQQGSDAQRQGQQARAQIEAVRDDRFPGGGNNNSATITVNGERRTRSFNDRSLPDSVPILRANFDTRKVDTVTFMRVTNPRTEVAQTPEGGMQVTLKMNPLPQNDDWALMGDGSVAVVRVLDYRIDWFKADGTLERSAPLPFAWKRLTDDDKTRIVDSLKTVAKDLQARLEQMGAGGGGGQGGRGGFRPRFEPTEAEALPDYFPPIRPGTTLADYDGNLWLLPATSTVAGQLAGMIPPGAAGRVPPGMLPGGMAAANTAGLVYDVVNRAGELVERIQIPAGRTIAGFGPKGVVYLTAREGNNVFLEKARRTTN